jgi:uncharacterized membrane protein YtjA (UPF0391 family)
MKAREPQPEHGLCVNKYKASSGWPFLFDLEPAGSRKRWYCKFQIMEFAMLYYALVFLVIALIAGVLGFGGIAGASAGIAQILFFLFLAFLVISLVIGLFRRT